MHFREVTAADHRVICHGLVDMQRAETLAEMKRALVRTAMAVAPCDHGGYTEIDVHFGRFDFMSSESQVSEWAVRRAETWNHFFPTHPVHRFRLENPDIRVVRLSDLIPTSDFRHTGLYRELFREVSTEHQVTMHLGVDPRTRLPDGALPTTLGVPLNRSGRDFSAREVQSLSLLQQLAMPVLRLRRSQHRQALMDAAALSPELARAMMRMGLSPRQTEVAFWMLKGKSNTDIAAILDVGMQTVRQHTIEIYRRLGIAGRLALQRVVLQSVTGLG
ncbi:MAG: helix-turn-helix transcriptional regulator [Paracoccaceae bacterium]|nr:MAG: helix-turn-helix transcriptional regulator [Paracoccaceae bacterium]